MAVKLDIKVFEKMVNSCKAASDINQLRPQLRLVNIDVKENKLRMWAMDGYRVEVDEIEVVNDKDFKASFENMYIPKFNTEVTLDLVGENLEVVFYPSGFKIVVPQNFQGDLWNVDEFLKQQSEIEKQSLFLKKEFIADAIKKAGKKGTVEIRKQAGDRTLTPVEFICKQEGFDMSMKTYVLPIRVNY